MGVQSRVRKARMYLKLFKNDTTGLVHNSILTLTEKQLRRAKRLVSKKLIKRNALLTVNPVVKGK